MEHNLIIEGLADNSKIFQTLLADKSKDQYLWKPSPEKWCLLEVACHLYDEEREDFRTRVRCTLETPGALPPGINPMAWVTERNYLEQDYELMVNKFLDERSKSVAWLRSLNDPCWANSYHHPELGRLSAEHFLTNWLAHDLLHFRQITRLHYQYLGFSTGIDLAYAGTW
jgi:hypothetical protein